jgi:hypothetical protein
MVMYTKELGNIICVVERALLPGQMDLLTQVNGKIMSVKVRESFHLHKENSIKDHGKMINDPDKALCNMLIKMYILELSKKIANKDKAL